MRTCSNCEYARYNRKSDTFYCEVHGDDTPKEYGENLSCQYHNYREKRNKRRAE